jgi:hypothetical protein
LVDPIYITQTLGEVTPFRLAPNVCVSFPHIKDWWNRWPAMHRQGGRNRTIHEFEHFYRNEKRLHRDGVIDRLNTLSRCATGRAVFAALRGRRDYSVHIFPFEFLPPLDYSSTRNAVGVSEMMRIPQTRFERAHGIKPRGTDFQFRGVSWVSDDRPGAVDIFYSEDLCGEDGADGTLLHELVHAMRSIWGLDRETGMRGGYPNSEEFYANTIEGIFRSGRGQAVYDYMWHPTNQEKVLKNPMARTLITKLCHQQMSLCNALAQVKADFNPIRPIAEKLFTIDL